MKPLIWVCAGVVAVVALSFGSANVLQHEYAVPNQEQQAGGAVQSAQAAPVAVTQESTSAVEEDCQKAYGQKACEVFALGEWMGDQSKKYYACSAFDTDFTPLPGDENNKVFIALAKGEFLDVAQASFYSAEQEKVLWGGVVFMNHKESRPKGGALLLHGDGQTADEDKTLMLFFQSDKRYVLSLAKGDKALVRVSGQCSWIPEAAYFKAM